MNSPGLTSSRGPNDGRWVALVQIQDPCFRIRAGAKLPVRFSCETAKFWIVAGFRAKSPFHSKKSLPASRSRRVP